METPSYDSIEVEGRRLNKPNYRFQLEMKSKELEKLKQKYKRMKLVHMRVEKELRMENDRLKESLRKKERTIENMRTRLRTTQLVQRKERKKREKPRSLPTTNRSSSVDSDFELAKRLQREEEEKLYGRSTVRDQTSRVLNEQFFQLLTDRPNPPRFQRTHYNNYNNQFEQGFIGSRHRLRQQQMNDPFHPPSPLISSFQHHPPQQQISENATYEELLELDKQNVTVGLNPNLLNQYPIKTITSTSSTHQQEKENGPKEHKQQQQEESCAICFDEFKIGQRCRTLPCLHSFHMECIDKWLKTHKKCPMCLVDLEELQEKQQKQIFGGGNN